jgi:SpoVK/Ycf46/Vps4 family AAA+-type ATPase
MSNLDGMIEGLREALAVTPSNVPLRVQLAKLLLDADDVEAAEAEFKTAVKIDDSNIAAKRGLAEASERQGKNGIALVILEEAVEAAPEDADSWMLFARVLLKTGQIGDSKAAYQRALKINPDKRDQQLDDQFGSIGTDVPKVKLEDENSDVDIIDGRVRQAVDEDYSDDNVIDEVEESSIDFSSVGGMDNVKDEIRLKIILPMTNKDLYAAYGKKVGGGILMYGPPGCGKTHLARATAGEANAKFINVGLNDVLNMWIGQSEQRLHQIFEQARRCAPSVLFFDEVDALGAKRSDMRQSAGRQLINQFLSELDGIGNDNEGVLVLAATNAPWHLDSAFRRPGRFDRIIFVPPPDEVGRARILQLLTEKIPTEKLDVDKVAKKLKNFSGADLKALIDMVIEEKLRGAMKTGVPSPLTGRDLLKMSGKLHVSTKDWFNTARNYAVYANESALYDDVLDYLNIRVD